MTPTEPSTSKPAADFLARGRHAMLINGEWTAALGGGTLAVLDPATEKEIATVPAAGPADVDLA